MYIYLLDTEKIDDYSYTKIFSKQTIKRKKKAQRFIKKEDAQRCIFAGALIKYCLKKEKGIDTELEIVYNQFGKPRIKDLECFFFNISHSDKWVVLASSTREVGIDVQKIVNKKYDIGNNFFSHMESSYILDACDVIEYNKRFFEIWSLKESYLKYRGIGFAYGGSKVSINPVTMSLTSENGYEKENLNLKVYTFLEGYILAVCGEETEISFEFVDKQSLL